MLKYIKRINGLVFIGVYRIAANFTYHYFYSGGLFHFFTIEDRKSNSTIKLRGGKNET